MNLGLEYLVRSGLIKEFFQTPCSLFLEKDHNKKVVVLAEKRNKKLAQHWNVFQCNDDEALPPMNEYEVDDFFHCSQVVPEGYHIVEYEDQPVPSRANKSNRPMEAEIYVTFCNAMMNSWAHHIKRREWLWQAFLSTYEVEMPILPWGRWNQFLATFKEQEEVRLRHPRKWRYWQLWMKYMLQMSDTAPELVFTSFS